MVCFLCLSGNIFPFRLENVEGYYRSEDIRNIHRDTIGLLLAAAVLECQGRMIGALFQGLPGHLNQDSELVRWKA